VPKLNRIGNKLGLAGLFGVLLSGGMVINQMTSESAINSANQRAEQQRAVSLHALEGNIGLRRMQLAARDIRLSQTQSSVEKGLSELGQAKAITTKELDSAYSFAMTPENKERLQKIMSLAVEYEARVLEIAKAELKIFESLDRRNGLSAKTLKGLLASSVLIGAANKVELEKALYEADSIFNSVRAAS
jgi:hypothetical protein